MIVVQRTHVCQPCAVEWLGAAPCWNCGAPGEERFPSGIAASPQWCSAAPPEEDFRL